MCYMQCTYGSTPIVQNQTLDSLQILLDSKLSDTKRLDALHHACSILYKEDSNQELLYDYAKEGVEIAKELGQIDKGADLAVWILRANIYLRSYDRNPPYYAYLKSLFKQGKIEKQKYIQPLYSEIYSYIDYGKMKEAETKMAELSTLIDRNNPKQLTYYLDPFIAFKRKSKEYKAAAKALEEFAAISNEIEDPRFSIIALSRNAEFYLEDSLDLNNSRKYAEKALRIVNEKDLPHYKQSILLQLSKAYYKMGRMRSFLKNYTQISVDSFSSNDHILRKDYLTFSGDIKFNDGEYEEASKLYTKAVQYLENSDFASMEILTKKIERCHVKLKDYRAAFTYANRLNVLKDSLYNEENIKALNFFESKLRFKDAETARIKLENRVHAQKKSTIYIGFFSSLLLLSLLFYNRILDEKVKIRTAALDSKNHELEDSLEELKQFNYIASHDIKEPMRVVSSVTGLIEKKLQKENNNKYQSEFKLVKNSISQLYTLIEDLSQFLDFKSKTFTHQLVNTQTLTGQVTQMLGNVTKQYGGTITFNDLPEIYSSSSLLTVVFKNLIENGLKYNNSDVPHVAVSYEAKDDKHEFHFIDNGIGIDKQYHNYIFQMFKRLENREKEGSGLGLGMVDKAVEKLGGEIKLDSKKGQGSTFTVVLPIGKLKKTA